MQHTCDQRFLHIYTVYHGQIRRRVSNPKGAAVRDDKTVADMEAQIGRLKEEYQAVIFLLKIDCMDISSSQIRRKVADGISIPAISAFSTSTPCTMARFAAV